MPILLSISFRNLIRQKRRNILLGIAIAFGTMVLILANAFSHGISSVLFTQIVKYTNGHVALTYMRNGNWMSQVFPDADRIRGAIQKSTPPDSRTEEAIGVFGRAIGNGVADNVIMVGVDLNARLSEDEMKEYESNFKMLHGSFLDLKDKTAGFPVVLAEQKAKYLNVKMGDALRARFTGVTGQSNSAHLVVVGIFKPANIFMSSPIFLELQDLRKLVGYGPHDLAGIHVNLTDPQQQAKTTADRIHALLRPGLAAIPGEVRRHNQADSATLLCIRTDSASVRVLARGLRFSLGDSAAAFGPRGVIAASALARRLGAGPGDTLRFSWTGKFESGSPWLRCVVTAVADSTAPIPPGALLLNERDFYHAYYRPLPAPPSPEALKALPDSSNPLWAALGPEYLLMKRSANTTEYTKAMKEMGRARFKGILMSVESMYETASAILKVEMALNLITFVASMVLFFIILVGVVNTLRMTIRERTREIGTVRAIGMQKADVRNSFILETCLLALFSATAGTGLAFVLMKALSSISIEAADNPMGMLLVNGHLFFQPTVVSVAGYNLLVLAIAAVTAFFPARRAAALSAAEALRHYD
jgi:ABC-type lipoprotein release transport system permease subunit